jgi:PAS domain S-box-containing protein
MADSTHEIESRTMSEVQELRRQVAELECKLAEYRQVGVRLAEAREPAELAQAGEQLRYERDFAVSLVEAARTIVLLLDPQGRIVRFNPYMEEISGYRLEEVQGKDWFTTFLPGREHQRITQLFGEAISGGRVSGNVNPIVTKDGRERLIEWYDAKLHDPQGNLVGLLAVGQDITEQREAQSQIQRKLAEQEALFAAIQAYVFMKDRQGRYIGCNIFFADLVGKPIQQIVGKTDYELFPQQEAEVNHRRDRQVMSSGEATYDIDEPRTGPDGRTRWFYTARVPYRDGRGEVIGMVGTAMDITGRKQTEQALRAEQARLTQAQRIAQVGDWEIDLATGQLSWSEEVFHLFDRDVALGAPTLDENLTWHDPAEREKLKRCLEEVRVKGESRHIDLCANLPSGRKAYLHGVITPVKDRQGQVVKLVGTIQDVTELKEAVALRHESQARLDLVLEQLPAVLWTTDTELRVTSTAGAGLERLGVKSSKIVGKTLYHYLRGVEENFPAFVMHRRALAGESVQYELNWNGTTFDTRVEPLRDVDGRIVGCIGVAHDITERKRAEQQRLAHLEYMQSVDRVDLVLQRKGELSETMTAALETILSIFQCDRAWLLFPCDPNASRITVPMEVTRPEYPGAFAGGGEIELTAEVAEAFRAGLQSREPLVFGADDDARAVPSETATRFSVKSVMCLTIYPQHGDPWMIGLHQCAEPRRWTANERRMFRDIGARVAEALGRLLIHRDLQESENRLRTLIDVMPDIVCFKDEQARWLVANEAYLKTYRLTSSDYKNKTDEALAALSPFFRLALPNCRKSDESAWRQGGVVRAEEVIVDQAGRSRVLDVIKVPLYHANGDRKGMVVLGRDMTERKRAEEQLRHAHAELEERVIERTARLTDANQQLEAEIAEREQTERALRAAQERLQFLLSSNAAVIFTCETTGVYGPTFVSENVRELWGYEAKQFTDDPSFWVQRVHPEDRQRLLASVAQVFETGQHVAEYRFLHGDGRYRWVHEGVRLVRERDGSPLELVGFLIDITEQKEVQKQLSLVQAAVEQVQDVVVITDANMDPPGPRIVYVNPAFTEVTGYKPEEVVGTTPRILQGPRPSRDLLESFNRQLRRGRSFSGEAVQHRKDNSEYTVQWQLTPIRDAAGKIINWVSIERDITEKKQSEELNRQHQAELAHVARLSTMGEMASGLAHELNQPLAAINNYVQGCMRRFEAGTMQVDDLKAALGHVLSQADRAGEIIRRMRNFVRKREPRRSTIDVNGLVHNVISLIDPEAREHSVKIRTELAEGLPLIIGDNIQIEQVLVNLVRNAMDAMLQKDLDDRRLVITTSLDRDEFVHISVIDRGVGMDDQELDHIFDPFFTTKPHGMGMGLTISKTIVDSHGGRIWARRNRTWGMTFHVALPTAELA